MINLGLFYGRKLKIGQLFFDGHISEMGTFPTELTSVR